MLIYFNQIINSYKTNTIQIKTIDSFKLHNIKLVTNKKAIIKTLKGVLLNNSYQFHLIIKKSKTIIIFMVKINKLIIMHYKIKDTKFSNNMNSNNNNNNNKI